MDYVAQPFQKSPLSLLPHDLPCLPAFLSLPQLRMCKHVYILREGREGGGEGGGGGGGRVDEGVLCADKQRFARWDLWFNVPARAFGLFSRV